MLDLLLVRGTSEYYERYLKLTMEVNRWYRCKPEEIDKSVNDCRKCVNTKGNVTYLVIDDGV